MNNIKCPHCGLVNRLGTFTCLRCKRPLVQTAGAGSQGARAATAAASALKEVASERPLWVAIGLWGLKTRLVALAFVALSVLLGTGLMLYWSWQGALVYMAALWYFLAIRWVDKNGSW